MGRHVVAAVGEIAEGERKLVTLEGREIGVFNVKGEFYALLNKCPHSGAELCRGMVIGLAQSDEPGEYKLTRPGEFLRCPGTDGIRIRTGHLSIKEADAQSTTYNDYRASGRS